MNSTELFNYLFEKYNISSFYMGYIKRVCYKPYDKNTNIIVDDDELVEEYYYAVLLQTPDGNFIDIKHPENNIARNLEPNQEGYTVEYVEPITEYCSSEIKDKGEIFGFRALIIGDKSMDRFEQNRRLVLNSKKEEVA